MRPYIIYMNTKLTDKVLVLDGAMGTMIQRLKLTESDFRGDMFADSNCQLAGNNDLLSLTHPEKIAAIHRQYLEAGADIISTNTFNANAISQADYATEKLVKDINRAAAKLARSEAARFMAEHPDRKIFVAGSVGPTNRSASMSPKMDDPAYRDVDYDALLRAYREQIEALAEGGVDLILFETVFDTLNLKAGLESARQVSERLNRKLPVMVSATLAGPSGRILSGQTLGAFVTSIAAYDNVISVGLNCSWGARDMQPFIEELSAITPLAVSCHPNAGLPDENGCYKESADSFAEAVSVMMSRGLVNIVGGCCGTTPDHIRALASAAAHYAPRIAPTLPSELRVAGLETLEISPASNFINVGERCNVAGSRKFLRLIKEGSYDEALAIARKQVDDGAQIIDVNMDDSMIDAAAEMTRFLRLIASDPDVARVPLMIDSSEWSVLEAGLKCVQGKCIVNSISLKEGEDEFLRKAEAIRRFGAAVVVMAFDEQGQADTFERKIEICERAYRLLTRRIGFAPHDIIFDPNIMAVATGIPEHDLYGRDFIRAVKWIKDNLPGAKVSGGVSNLSFAFRGHNGLRESMHAVFLYHAIAAGLDMAIVNPSATVTYSDVAEDLRHTLDDLFTKGSHEAAAALASFADCDMVSPQSASGTAPVDRDTIPVAQRLTDAIVRGDATHLADDLEKAAELYDRAISIIEGPLMEGVGRVGTLFGEGKMFLPQVVKTARVMKQAVDLLKPRIEAEKVGTDNSSAGKILFATVKGDVHDIGKNIVSIVLECNNYEVIDLGVMVPAETIVAAAIDHQPDIICLSGLITPSLGEMVNVAEKLQQAGVKTPLIVGGATTSKLHTAVKIAPHTSAPVIHATDASQNPIIASKLLNAATREAYIQQIAAEYDALRDCHSKGKPNLLPLSEARRHKAVIDWAACPTPVPMHTGVDIIDPMPVDEVAALINWRMYFNFWKLSGDFVDDFPYDLCEHCTAQWLARHSSNPKAIEALKVYRDAISMLRSSRPAIRGAVGIFPAWSDDDDTIVVGGQDFPMLRRQEPNAGGACLSPADYVMPHKLGEDFVGAFVVSADARDKLAEIEDDKYAAMVLRALLDRLAEAGAEYLHRYVRRQYWGYAPDETLSVADILSGKYQGIRPAMGYPMTPDQLLNHKIAKLLPFDRIGVTLTEAGAMSPASTVSGLYIAHPDARYFMIGKIGDDQLSDYSRRRAIAIDRMRDILNKNL